MLSTELVP